MFAEIFKWGMGLGEFLMGMPFLVAAVCFVLALLFVLMASPTGDRSHDQEFPSVEIEARRLSWDIPMRGVSGKEPRTSLKELGGIRHLYWTV